MNTHFTVHRGAFNELVWRDRGRGGTLSNGVIRAAGVDFVVRQRTAQRAEMAMKDAESQRGCGSRGDAVEDRVEEIQGRIVAEERGKVIASGDVASIAEDGQ